MNGVRGHVAMKHIFQRIGTAILAFILVVGIILEPGTTLRVSAASSSGIKIMVQVEFILILIQHHIRHFKIILGANMLIRVLGVHGLHRQG